MHSHVRSCRVIVAWLSSGTFVFSCIHGLRVLTHPFSPVCRFPVGGAPRAGMHGRAGRLWCRKHVVQLLEQKAKFVTPTGAQVPCPSEEMPSTHEDCCVDLASSSASQCVGNFWAALGLVPAHHCCCASTGKAPFVLYAWFGDLATIGRSRQRLGFEHPGFGLDRAGKPSNFVGIKAAVLHSCGGCATQSMVGAVVESP